MGTVIMFRSPARTKGRDRVDSRGDDGNDGGDKGEGEGKAKKSEGAESEPEDEDAQLMKEMMGFSKFDTTKVEPQQCIHKQCCFFTLSSLFKGKHVSGNNVFGMVKIREPKRFRSAGICTNGYHYC